jgi:hypothetical protein
LNKLLTSVPLLAATLIMSQCKDMGTEPPLIPERVKLTLIDASVQEVFIHVAISNPMPGETLVLQRNGATVMTFAAVADANVADTSLMQNTTYAYRAILTAPNAVSGSSNMISATTLTPSSHNFTWQSFLLGHGNGSALYDVAIINDTLAYAVGEMYLRDTTGRIDPVAYNMAKWNGNAWQIKRIQFYTICGQTSRTPYPARPVMALSATDVWFAMDGDQVATWNGTTQTATMCLPWSFSIRRLAGASSNSIYAVGDGGNIAYYDGNSWQRVQGGTTTQITDAWGATNPVSGDYEVYCAVSSFFSPQADRRILRISGHTTVDSIRWDPQRNLDGIWTHNGFPLYTAGDGVFQNGSGRWQEVDIGASIYTNAIRGTGLNHIVAVGDFGVIAAFDGLSWQRFFENANASYYSVATKNNLTIAVGELNGRGFVTIGRRN